MTKEKAFSLKNGEKIFFNARGKMYFGCLSSSVTFIELKKENGSISTNQSGEFLIKVQMDDGKVLPFSSGWFE